MAGDERDQSMTSQRVTQSRNSVIGLVLFFVYLAFYGGFVLLNAFAADLMEKTPVAGLNVAILYGFFLIVFALVLSAIYGVVCRNPSADRQTEKSK